MIYKISDKPKTIKEYLLYGSQQTLSILTATILISTICGTNVAAGLVGAGIATITFLFITKFKAPLFFSNSGSTCAAVVTALSLCNDYTGVVIGGAIACLMNIMASIICKRVGTNWISKLLPPVISGTIVLIIGLNLSSFCPTYAQVNGEYNLIGILIALVTMIITVITMHYAKGRLSTIPFLVGALGGYVLCVIITLLGIAPLIDFNLFKEMTLFIKPDFAFYHLDFVNLNKAVIPTIVLTFAAVNLANIGEHISDVLAVSAVVDEDLTKTVGLDKTFLGDGVADLLGTLIAGNPTTTYSESLSTIAVSGVASTRVVFVGAILTILLGFFGPFNTFILSMPNCIFAGISLVCYGMIATSGVKVLLDNKASIGSREIIIMSVMMTVGISGLAISFGAFTLEKIAFSMIVGLLLNVILKR